MCAYGDLQASGVAGREPYVRSRRGSWRVPRSRSTDVRDCDGPVKKVVSFTVSGCRPKAAASAAHLDGPKLRDAAAYGLDGCLDAVVEVEFREDAGDVVVDGVGAERELVRDVVIAPAAGEPFEDFWGSVDDRG